jgi:hypothetical protein
MGRRIPGMPDAETRSAMGGIFWLGIAVIALFVVAALVYWVIYPTAINWQRNAVQHSNQYQQTRVQELTDGLSQYNRMETEKAKYAGNPDVVAGYEAQQAQLVHKMWITYDLIPNDIKGNVVPGEVQMFLASHPR